MLHEWLPGLGRCSYKVMRQDKRLLFLQLK